MNDKVNEGADNTGTRGQFVFGHAESGGFAGHLLEMSTRLEVIKFRSVALDSTFKFKKIHFY